MLTVKQPPTYGYKSVHDLPTPPSTSRPSPPLTYQEHNLKALPVISRSHSPPMSAPHRGLPPPAAMALPHQQPPAAGPPPSSHHGPPPHPQVPQAPPALTQSHPPRESWSQLPAPPPQWQGAEDSMRNWLQTRAEEEKRRQEEAKARQEEERTRQEGLRLEQRKIEMDMLRTSLSGGIPPALVPLVFAGMGSGGVLPQAVLEWAQQYLPTPQAHHPQLMPPQPVSPEHQRAQETHGQYPSLAAAPGAPPPGGYGFPGSPTRPRGQTVAGTIGRPLGPISGLPSLNTNIPQPVHGIPAMAHPHLQHAQSAHQEPQASPSIYFHHWQPPTSQASSGSNRPGTPSGETTRKRKAPGQTVPSPPRGDIRFRSPPLAHSSMSNPPRARRGHTRQRSDMSSYRSSVAGRSRRESFGGPGPLRRMSPIRSPALASLRGPGHESGTRERSEPPKQSISSMLSEEPRPPSQQSEPTYATGEREGLRRRTSPVESKPPSGTGQSREDEGEGEGMREGM